MFCNICGIVPRLCTELLQLMQHSRLVTSFKRCRLFTISGYLYSSNHLAHAPGRLEQLWNNLLHLRLGQTVRRP